jgi:hypothetical protein
MSNSVDDKMHLTVRMWHLFQIYAVRRCLTTVEKFRFIKRKCKKQKTEK